jgi:ketosteroid isomerase-like protein
MQLVEAALVLLSLALQPQELIRVDWSKAASIDREIEALRGDYAAAVNAGDVGRAADLYTADALAVMCDGSLVRGASAITGRLADRANPHARVTLMPRRFSAAETLASETGAFTETIDGPDGRASVEGVYVTIYSRKPGQPWRIALEVRTTGHVPALAIW